MSFTWNFETGVSSYFQQLHCAPVVPGTLVILCRDGANDKELLDDGTGVLYGDGIGVVDYETGWIAFDFYGISPAIGTPILADYDPVEGGCASGGCGKCLTSYVRLSVTPNQISGSDQFTIQDAFTRLFTKIERDILPVHVEIIRELLEEMYSVNIVHRFDVIEGDIEPLDTSGLHVALDDTSW
jgi:hypothetical protein